MGEARCPLQLRDDRIERAVLVIRRTEIPQPNMLFGGDLLGKRFGQAGFADARFGGDQHHPSVA